MSVNEQIIAIQRTLSTKGGIYSNYRCKNVSWDDVSRFGAGGGISGLSCVGSNITDTRLHSKNGELLYTVRPENWNEKIAMVSADEVSLIHNGVPTTLRDYISNFSKNAKYACSKNTKDLHSNGTDDKISLRFQTTFLPVDDKTHGNIELAPEAYNYGQKNINLLCTSQGTSVQQNSSGKNKLFHHEVDSNGTIHRYWFEVERSKHSVGSEQVETEEEAKEALERGKSIATRIGIEAMGTRFNVLMTVQIPTVRERVIYRGKHGHTNVLNSYSFGGSRGLDLDCGGGGMFDESDDDGNNYRGFSKSVAPRVSAGRLSRGSEYDTWDGIKEEVVRDHNQHITVTIVLYNTVAGGVPTEEDVTNAIDDMEKLYQSCQWNGNLGDTGASFTSSVPKYTPPIQTYNPLVKKFPSMSLTERRENSTDCKV